MCSEACKVPETPSEMTKVVLFEASDLKVASQTGRDNIKLYAESMKQCHAKMFGENYKGELLWLEELGKPQLV